MAGVVFCYVIGKEYGSGQGSQFTCPAWEEYLEEQKITISMDGKGKCLDNIFIGATKILEDTKNRSTFTYAGGGWKH